MFAFLFSTTNHSQDDGYDMEVARQTLQGRMDAMLEQQARRSTRFAVIEHPQR